jgi:selenocysteine-specific elongation factor
MPREELRSRLKVPSGVYSHILRQASADSSFVDEGHTIRLSDHSISFSVQQQESIDRLMVKFRELGVNAPSVKEAQEQVGVDVYYALIDMAAIIQISNDVVYSDGVYKKLLKQIVSYLQANGRIDAAKLRDLLNTSRKYSIAILEHLDEIKVTKRVDDYRVLVP